MKINQKLISLSIVFTFLVVMASNVTVVDAMEVNTFAKVASNVDSDSNPVWSPDGSEILFTRDGNLYRIFSDGSGEKKLTDDAFDYRWSPDGSKISYCQGTEVEQSGYGYTIWIMNAADITKKNQLLPPAYSGSMDYYRYTWFPSGSKISYVQGHDNFGWLWEINSDGSENNQLSDNGRVTGAIAVSPDASKIAYSSSDDPGFTPFEIIVQYLNQEYIKINDGSIEGTIVQQTQSWQPQVWSPDGSKIVYYSDETGNGDIYTIKADGSEKTTV